MHIRFWQTAFFFVVMIMVAGCGAPSDADLAASQQHALLATLAAAPTAQPTQIPIDNRRPTTDERTTILVTQVVPTSKAAVATSVATAMPTNAPTEDATTSAATQPIEKTAVSTQIQSSPTTKVSAPSATVLPTTKPTDTPPTPLPPTDTPPTPDLPTPAPVVVHNGVSELKFSELYSGASIEGPVLSDKAKQLNGNTIVMSGYMAPPLKPDLDFFVLTKDPMVYCPFCSSAADWPFDIVFVRMANGTVPALTPTQGIRVTGTFQTGTATDAATGFVSQIRIIADIVDVTQ